VLAPYPQLVRAGYRRYASYRQATLAGLATNAVFGLLRAAVLAAVLAERGTVGGYDLATPPSPSSGSARACSRS
jgi:ABC-2 type transport system permease protein